MSDISHKKVDFVIVGQPKSGTTALAHFLSQHPDISISVPKEPAYFCTDFHKESDDYHGYRLYFHYRTPDDFDALFSHAHTDDLLGEASTSYLYSKVAAKNIYAHNPQAKIIIILRNPVDLVHSLHMQYVNETQEDERNFKKALALEASRKLGKNNSKRIAAPSYAFYSERIKYAQQIKRFREYFSENQILVLIFEQFRRDNPRYYRRVLEFIGADTGFLPNFTSIHGSKAPRSTTLNRILNVQLPKTLLHKVIGPSIYTKLHDSVAGAIMKSARRPDMDSELRHQLSADYLHEVENVSNLLDTDLVTEWKYTEILNE